MEGELAGLLGGKMDGMHLACEYRLGREMVNSPMLIKFDVKGKMQYENTELGYIIYSLIFQDTI